MFEQIEQGKVVTIDNSPEKKREFHAKAQSRKDF